MKAIEAAYMAGFFDGEGSLGMYIAAGSRKKHYHYSRAQVGNTDREVVQRLHDLYGGSLITRNVSNKALPTALPVHVWLVTGERCNQFLTDIVPFLRQKKYKAQRLLEYYTKRKLLSWDEKEVMRMEFIALNGMSGKTYRPQRLNEMTP